MVSSIIRWKIPVLISIICIIFMAGGISGAEDMGSPCVGNPYTIVDTGQKTCYNARMVITCPSDGEAFSGQDARFSDREPAYNLENDGLVVTDKNTCLVWQRSPDTNLDGKVSPDDKLTYADALALPASLNAARFGGYDDWRLPTIKELYSLISFAGTDPSGETAADTSSLKPFIDTRYFDFVYGNPDYGERIIDSQYVSSTKYVGSSGRETMVFGVNFADGRIKGYGLYHPPSASGQVGISGEEKTFYVICVRGDPDYGMNAFVDNSDGTITDLATGLMWSAEDSGKGMDWQQALSWVQMMNDKKYLGYNDWRLPDAKELQSIVDYSRSPETSSSAAMDPVFSCTRIINENGEPDYPWYWTGTTHTSSNGMGANAVYIAFGRALGYMNGEWRDVHGAGAQRSDPKTGSASDYPFGHGPQGDAIRIDNYVRLVRDIT